MSSADIANADALGLVIRLIAQADVESIDGQQYLLQRVRPSLVSKSHPLSSVDGSTNAVVTEGNFSGRLLFQGPGAGAGPTASSVVADLIDIARNEVGAPFSIPASKLTVMPKAEPGERTERVYLRFTVADRAGVLAEITAAMRDAGVSIESLIQNAHPNQSGDALVAIVTHEGPEKCISEALRLLEGSSSLTAKPLVLPILPY